MNFAYAHSQGNFDMKTGDVLSDDIKAQVKSLVVGLIHHIHAKDIAILNSKYIQDEIAARRKRHEL
jgi:hypothetical protein